MSREAEDLNRRLLRARDAMDRAYAEPLDVRALAAVVEPMDHVYGADMGIRDPFGNGIRILQHKSAIPTATARLGGGTDAEKANHQGLDRRRARRDGGGRPRTKTGLASQPD